MPLTQYTPRPLTVTRSTTSPDRYHLAYEGTEQEPASSHDLVRWHDAVAAVEFQRPSWRQAPVTKTVAGVGIRSTVHPAIVELLDDVRHQERTGIAAVTLAAEWRYVR
jgi:hypothetical protein